MVDVVRKSAQEETYIEVNGELIPVRAIVGGGGGGGGGPVTMADGASVTLGTTGDTEWNETGSATGISLWKRAVTRLSAILAGIGTPADVAYTGSGNTTTIAALKGIHARLLTLTTSVVLSRAGAVLNATINSGASEPTANSDISQYSSVVCVLPTTFDGTSLTFKGAKASGDTPTLIYDRYGSVITIPVAAGRVFALPIEIAAFPYIRIVSSATETGARTIALYGKR